MIKTALFAAAAALATVATATPVLAKDVVVRYGDLDLASAKGQRDLERRINRAARVACEYHTNGRIPSADTIRCYRAARASAKTEIALALQNNRLGG